LEAASLGGGSHTMSKPALLMVVALFLMTFHHGYVWCEYQWKPCSITSLLLPSSGAAVATGAARTSANRLVSISAAFLNCFNMEDSFGGKEKRVVRALSAIRGINCHP
jgi:hypothetical protein